MGRSAITLDDKYDLDAGAVYLSGIQALVRLPLLQRDRDLAAGLDTAGFISGYRGSPLAGLDQQLEQARGRLEGRQIVFRPGLNEELAATAVWGSQQVGLHPGARHAGVFGMWYGKAPGVDRAADALRHANAAGTSRHGGVLLVAGDDHACKSSSYPTQSEYAMMHLEIPVLAPATVQEVLDFGLLGWAMSRYSGLWVSLIALTDLMDGSSVVRVGPDRVPIVRPLDFRLPVTGVHIRSGDSPVLQEERLREYKLPAASAFARANGVDHVVIDCERPRLVIVASGKAYVDTRQALADLRIDADAARRLGIRLVKVGMPWPLDGESMRSFVAGAEQVLVVEEKRPLIETQLKEQLHDLPASQRPRVFGKHDQLGQPLLRSVLELDAASVAQAIAHVLPVEVDLDGVDDYLARLLVDDTAPVIRPTEATRKPYFCSGCPHNTSTRVPEGSRAMLGIGCHYMVQWMDRDSDHLSQMGGEGAAWIGQAPFTDEPHIFANLGDGTYSHSGSLAIRAAVAAGSRITYKILYNGAVAMTGGQPLDATLGVPEMTRQLAAEGVRAIVVVSEQPDRFDEGPPLAEGVRVEPRSRLEEVQLALREMDGVTVLIYDQGCAAEKRRKRKRGLLPAPDRRVFINELVCEGCGDCSVASNCLSIEPVETEFGRKRHVNQSSCNFDYSCVEGSCPAFVSVVGGQLRKGAPMALEPLLASLPEPRRTRSDGVYNIVLTGVGGTGVTTVAALLGMAAHIEGRATGVLDMTGLAQKGGAVVSHVRLADDAEAIHGSRVPARSADLLIGCDAVVAAGEQGLGVLDPGRSQVVLNTRLTATAAFVMDNDIELDRHDMTERIGRASRELHPVPATTVVERALGDAIGTNLFLLGYAWQLGRVPLEEASILRALELNAVALEMNRRAFRLGRLAAHDGKLIDDWMNGESRVASSESLDELIDRRALHLVDYQDERYAALYREWVDRVRVAETSKTPGSEQLTRSVAIAAFKLMAYKDEYEVARLYSDGRFREALEREFEGDYQVELHLSPPAFASRDPRTGRLRKRRYGPFMLRVMSWLARGRRLRGSPLDPFGWQAERRAERALVRGYFEMLEQALPLLSADTRAIVCELADLPLAIRGFDVVRRPALEAAAREQDRLMAELRAAAGAPDARA
jgi:indolepyruvate ferredoxin oxidoreductase